MLPNSPYGLHKRCHLHRPMEPELRLKNYDAADYTDDAINKDIAWFYNTNAYRRGNIAGVYSEHDAFSAGSR